MPRPRGGFQWAAAHPPFSDPDRSTPATLPSREMGRVFERQGQHLLGFVVLGGAWANAFRIKREIWYAPTMFGSLDPFGFCTAARIASFIATAIRYVADR